MIIEFLENLKPYLKKYRPTNICEIGTHRAASSVQILQFLTQNLGLKNVQYTGYDLFNGLAKTNTSPATKKNKVADYKTAEAFLSKHQKNMKYTFKLIKGDTKETLTKQKFDFVFLDGGHTYEMAKHDYEQVKESKLILFDDTDIPGIQRLMNELRQDDNLIVEEFVPQKGIAWENRWKRTNNIPHSQAMVIRK